MPAQAAPEVRPGAARLGQPEVLARLWARLHVDRWVRTRSRLAIAGVATVVHALLYGLANRFPVSVPVELPLASVDRLTPLIPLTAWIYWSDYALLFVAFRQTALPVRFIRAFVISVVVAVVIHFLFPTIYPRALFPIGAESESLTGALLARFRDLDAATSCFPSLHVAVATVAALAVRRMRGGVLIAIWAGLVAVSTLTTKQHYGYDVVGGLLLGGMSWALAARMGHPHEPHSDLAAA